MPLAENIVLVLQAFQVAFLLLHDWTPFGRLNDVRALRRTDSLRKIAVATAINTVPFAVGLIFSVQHAHDRRWPHWVRTYLWISYGLLFIGELQAWWIPYLGKPQPTRAAHYRELFGNTHAFLPARNGITPNTLHTVLHATTLLTLIALSGCNRRATNILRKDTVNGDATRRSFGRAQL